MLTFVRSLFVRQRKDNSYDHKEKPYKNQLAPAQRGGCVGKNEIACCRRHIAQEIKVARDRRNHARITKAGAVSAPKHTCRAVRGHNGKNDKHDIQYGL